MTQKRFTKQLQNTMFCLVHSLVFLSLCFAPLLSNVLQNLEAEQSVKTSQSKEVSKTSTSENAEDISEVGLNNPLKSFWSFNRLSQRYFTNRKYTPNKLSESNNFQHKALKHTVFYTSFQSTLLTSKHVVLEQPTPHLADAKRYLSYAKLQLEGG